MIEQFTIFEKKEREYSSTIFQRTEFKWNTYIITSSRYNKYNAHISYLPFHIIWLHGGIQINPNILGNLRYINKSDMKRLLNKKRIKIHPINKSKRIKMYMQLFFT